MAGEATYHRSNLGWVDEGHYPVEDEYSPDRIAHLVCPSRPPPVRLFVEKLKIEAQKSALNRTGITTPGMLRCQLVQLFMKNDLAHGDGWVTSHPASGVDHCALTPAPTHPPHLSDGRMTRGELNTFCSHVLNISMPGKDLDMIFRFFDEDASSIVTIDEFIDGVMSHTARPSTGVMSVSTGRSRPMTGMSGMSGMSGKSGASSRASSRSALSRAGSHASQKESTSFQIPRYSGGGGGGSGGSGTSRSGASSRQANQAARSRTELLKEAKARGKPKQVGSVNKTTFEGTRASNVPAIVAAALRRPSRRQPEPAAPAARYEKSRMFDDTTLKFSIGDSVIHDKAVNDSSR